MICTVLKTGKKLGKGKYVTESSRGLYNLIVTLRLSIEASLALGLTHCWLPETQDFVSFADVPGKLYKVPDT